MSEKNKRQLLIPRGFAHGFLALTDDVEFSYKVDNYYAPEAEGSIIWNDPEIGIQWGIENPILSEKDKKPQDSVNAILILSLEGKDDNTGNRRGRFYRREFCPLHAEKYDNYRIICLDALTYAGSLETLADVMDNPLFTFIKGDIADRDLVYSLFEREHPI